jgi:hypothetical protein
VKQTIDMRVMRITQSASGGTASLGTQGSCLADITLDIPDGVTLGINDAVPLSVEWPDVLVGGSCLNYGLDR